MPLGQVDPHSKDHSYVQIAKQLRATILDGEYLPGRLLPSEKTLGQHYGVARETVRKAIAVLKAEGYVVVVQHRGMFVADELPEP